MQFIKTRDVKDPVRVVEENAGIDLFIPENNEEFRGDFKKKNPYAWITGIVFDPFHPESAGACHAVYEYATGKIWIRPHHDIIIPTGIRSKFGPNLALIANNKSGIATKKKLIFGASVIDCSYQGEWHAHLINTSDEWQFVECGNKVIQFIPHLISTEPIEIVDKTPEEFYTEKTSRGEGWQGSTGVK